jgi:hypothetical protein
MRKQNDRRWMNEKGFMRLTTLWAVTAIVLCAVAGKVNAQTKAPEIIPASELLKGQSAMSVATDVNVKGDDYDHRPDIESRLQEAGIKVLPLADPPTYPRLTLQINASGFDRIDSCWEYFGTAQARMSPAFIYFVRLEYEQLIPAPGQAHKSVSVTTWSNSYYGMVGAIEAERTHFASPINDLVSEFMDAYWKANRRGAGETKTRGGQVAPARVITALQHREMVVMLEPYAGQEVDVIGWPQDNVTAETANLVKQVVEVMKDAGWRTARTGGGFPVGNPGITVHLQTGADEKTKGAASALVEALRQVGLETIGPVIWREKSTDGLFERFYHNVVFVDINKP